MDSKLQIISGAFRGKKLKIPLCARPTQNRARIAVFNMLAGILKSGNIYIWDAFAGAGAFGIECLSRYNNANVIFTDIADGAIKSIHDNVATLNVGARATVKQIDALSVVSHYASDVDLVFLDPPYANADLGIAFVKKFFARAKSGAIVIWEQDNTTSSLPELRNVNVLRDKKYGRARFLILQKQ